LFHLYVISKRSNDKECWELVLVCHHSIFDGRSAGQFLKEILEELDKGQMEDVVLENEDFKWPQPVEVQLNLTTPLSILIPVMGRELFPRLFRPFNKKIWLGPEESIPGKRTLNYEHFSVPHKHWTSLKKLCEKNSVSINSVINALIMTSLWKFLHKEEKDRIPEYNFSMRNAIDLRKFKPNEPFQVEVFMASSCWNENIHGSSLFWETAKGCQDSILKGINYGAKLFGSIKFIGKHWVEFKENVVRNCCNGRDATFFVSNLGLSHFPEKFGDNEVLSTSLAQEGATLNAVMSVYVTTAHKNSPINLTLSYSRTVFSHEKMEFFMDIFNDVLDKLIQNSDVKDWMMKVL